MENKFIKIAVPVAIVAVIIIAVAIFLNNRNATTNTETNTMEESMNTSTSNPTSNTVIDTNQVTINIAAMQFVNGTITVKKGTTVTWISNDETSHTVVANNGEFKSSTLTRGTSYSFTFENTGEFAYHCGIHPTMTGKITVE